MGGSRRGAEWVECKRAREAEVVGQMIATYCHGTHGTHAGELCDACHELDAYARARIARCRAMATKTFCSQCETHCYAPAM